MNTTTFINRIENLVMTKQGKIAKRYLGAISAFETMRKGRKIYPYSWSMHTGYCTLQGESYANKVIEIAICLGITLSFGNDAPRGGREGEYKCLSKREINKLKDVDFEEIYKQC